MRINCKAILCLFAIVFVLIGSSGMELLKNGNFQTISGSHPTNWIFYDWKGLSSLSVEQENQSNVVLISSKQAGGRATFTQNIYNLELEKGSTVKFSGWYKTGDVGLGEKGMLRVECVFNRSSNAKDKKFIKMNRAIILAPSPSQWKWFERSITLLSPVADLNFFILGYNFSGNLYLRDVSLEAVQQTNEIKSNMKYVWREAEQIFKGSTSTFTTGEKDYFSGTGGAYSNSASFNWKFQVPSEIDTQSLFPINRQYYVWLRLYGYIDSPEVNVLFKGKQITSFKTVANEIKDEQGNYKAPGKYYWQKAGVFQSDGGPASLTFKSTGRMLIDAVMVTDDSAYCPKGFELATNSDSTFFTDMTTPSTVKSVYNFNGVSNKIVSPLMFQFHNDDGKQIKTGDKPAILRLVLPKTIQVAGATAHWAGVSWGSRPQWGDKRLSWLKKGERTIGRTECNVYEFYYYYLGLTTTIFIKSDSGEFKSGQQYPCEYQLEFNGLKQPVEKLNLHAVELKPATAFKNIWIGFCGSRAAAYSDHPQLIEAMLFSGMNFLNPWHLRANNSEFEAFADKCLKNKIMVLGECSPLYNYPLLESEQMVSLSGKNKPRHPSLAISSDSLAVTSTRAYMKEVASAGYGLTVDDEHTNMAKDSVDYSPKMKKLFAEYVKTRGLDYIDPVIVVKNKDVHTQLYSAWVDFRCERLIELYRLYRASYLEGFASSGGKYTFGKSMFIPQIVKDNSPANGKINSFWDYKRLAEYSDYISPMIYTYQGIEGSDIVGNTIKMYHDYIGRKIIAPTLLAGHSGFGEIPLHQKPMIKYQIFESLMQQSKIIMFWAAPAPMDPLNLQFISDAIRQASPYEEIILNGNSVKLKTTPEWVRINALQLNKQILVYVANYRNDVSRKVQVHLPGKAVSVLDIETGGNLPLIGSSFETNFKSSRGKLFLITQ